MSIERILLQEVADQLGYQDQRSARRWCILNRVGILSDAGVKKCYVIRTEFEAARLREFIKHLKAKHGEENWIEAFKAHMNLNIMHVIALEEENVPIEQRNNYQPESEHEKKFLVDLQKDLTELPCV